LYYLFSFQLIISNQPDFERHKINKKMTVEEKNG